MGFLEIISIVIFPISLGSFQLAVEQNRTPLIDRIGMFRGEVFTSIVFFPSLILMVASGIVVLFYSWILLLGLFVGTAITFQLFGKFLLIRAWYLPLRVLDKWAKKKLVAVDYQQSALRAEQLNIQGNYRAVVKLLEPHAKRPNNKNTFFFNELGIAYGKIGSQLQDTAFWHKAYHCHKNAYRLDSNEPIYMFNLAMAATWIENYEDAQELLTKYLESGHGSRRELAIDILKKLNTMKLSDMFIKSYNLSKTTQYRFECKRKSLFSLPENKIPNLDFHQLAFIEGSKKYSFLNDLLVMFRLRNRLIIEVLVPIEEDNNSIDIWTPNKRFFESIIYPLENDALNKVVCSKYLLIDFRLIGRINIDDIEDIYKRSRLEWDEAIIMQRGDTLKKEASKELSAIGIPHKHWFQEIWLSYQNEADRTCCIRIW